MESANHKQETGSVSFGPFSLSSGDVLNQVTLRYELTGQADAPVILVFHALTGNHHTVGTDHTPGWWGGLIGSHNYIDTNRYQVLTFNVLGGCNGSTGPAEYPGEFPEVTIRDMVHSQYKALQQLNVPKLKAVIGGSLGGMQALEWGLLYPETTEKLIILAAAPVLSDYGIAFNHLAGTAIKQNPSNGLALARMIGMVTYRTPDLFAERFSRSSINGEFGVTSYLDYQGEKLLERFHPDSYLTLLQAMNLHDIGYKRGGWERATEMLKHPSLVLSFDKDLIYDPDTMKAFSDKLPCGCYHHIQTNFGHDGFLTEFAKWGYIVTEFLEKEF